jgi:hypothetical protein
MTKPYPAYRQREVLQMALLRKPPPDRPVPVRRKSHRKSETLIAPLVSGAFLLHEKDILRTYGY